MKKYDSPVFQYLALFLIILVLYYILNLYRSYLPEKPKTMSRVAETTPAIRVPKTTSVIVPVDWKTYKNDKYFFELKYPDNWTINEYPDKENIVWWAPSAPKGPSSLSVKITDRQGKTVDEFMKRDELPYTFIRTFDTNLLYGKIYSNPVTEGEGAYIAVFSRNQKMYIFTLNYDPPKLDEAPELLLDKILASFGVVY